MQTDTYEDLQSDLLRLEADLENDRFDLNALSADVEAFSKRLDNFYGTTAKTV